MKKIILLSSMSLIFALILIISGCTANPSSTPAPMAGAGGADPSQFDMRKVSQNPIPGSSIPKYVDPLPSINTIVAGKGRIELEMTEFKSNVLPSTMALPGGAKYNGTWVWGYLQPDQKNKSVGI